MHPVSPFAFFFYVFFSAPLQAEAQRQKLASVPGMLNPYDEQLDDMAGGSD